MAEAVIPAGFQVPVNGQVDFNTTQEPRERDLALHRRTDASSSKSAERAHSLVVDGNHNTRWTSAYADRQWIAVDLGAIFKLDRVEIRWEYAHADVYRIEGSNEEDPMTWRTLADEQRGREGTVVSRLPSGSEARWVRMFGETRWTRYGFSMWEFHVYADPNLPQPPPPPPPPPREPILIPLFPNNNRRPNFARMEELAQIARAEMASLAESQEAAAAGLAVEAVEALEGESPPAQPAAPPPPPVAATLGNHPRRPRRKLPPGETPKLEGPLDGPFMPPATLDHLLGEIPCSICFELLQGCAVTITMCGHIFHERCLRLSDTLLCPQCRQNREEEFE